MKTVSVDVETRGLKISRENAEKFNELLKSGEFGDFRGFRLVKCRIGDDEMCIETDTYSGHFADAERFVHTLSSIIEEGEAMLYFNGDGDSETWGYEVTKGKVAVLGNPPKRGHRWWQGLHSNGKRGR